MTQLLLTAGPSVCEPAPIPPDTADTIPTADDESPKTATYRDWDPKATRVIRYWYGEEPPRNPAGWVLIASAADAREHARGTHGRILEEHYLPDAAFLRVKR